MTNSYENDINGLVDDIMKVAEEASASSGMEKEARIFNRKKKSELGANREKANAMFSGIGSDDSASDPKGKINRKWKRIKAKFFKKAHADTEEMIEKIAASAGTDVDVLLDYIEKIAAEEDMDGQDIVDTLYEDIEYEEEDPADEEEGEDYDEEEYEEDEEDGEDYDEEEEVVAEMIHEAIEKVAAVSGMDGETVLEYVANVARENEVDEIEVLAALEDEADFELEKEAGLKDKAKSAGRKINQVADRLDDSLGGLRYGKETYKEEKATRKEIQNAIEKLKSGEGSLDEYNEVVNRYKDVNDRGLKTQGRRMRIPATATGAALVGLTSGLATGSKAKGAAGAGAGALGGYALSELSGRLNRASGRAGANLGQKYINKKYSKNKENEMTEKEAFEMLVDDAIEKVAYVAGVDGDDVIDYVEKLAYENDLDEIEVLAELEKEAKLKMPEFVGKAGDEARVLRIRARGARRNAADYASNNKLKTTLGVGTAGAALGAGAYGYNKYKNRKSTAEEEKEAFEMLVDDAIEKVAYVSGVDGDDVIDYVEKLAYENDVDEIEVLASLEEEAEKEAFEMLVDDAIEKVAYVSGVDGDDVIDYVEKLAYENDLDEIEVLAELEKEAKLKLKFPRKFKGSADEAKAYADMMGDLDIGIGTKKSRFKGSPKEHWENAKMKADLYGMNHPKAQKAMDWTGAHKKHLAIGAGTAAGIGAGVYGYNKYKNRKARQEEASLSDVV